MPISVAADFELSAGRHGNKAVSGRINDALCANCHQSRRRGKHNACNTFVLFQNVNDGRLQKELYAVFVNQILQNGFGFFCIDRNLPAIPRDRRYALRMRLCKQRNNLVIHRSGCNRAKNRIDVSGGHHAAQNAKAFYQNGFCALPSCGYGGAYACWTAANDKDVAGLLGVYRFFIDHVFILHPIWNVPILLQNNMSSKLRSYRSFLTLIYAVQHWHAESAAAEPCEIPEACPVLPFVSTKDLPRLRPSVPCEYLRLSKPGLRNRPELSLRKQ